MPLTTTSWHTLSEELQHAILDLVPPEERVHTCRLVCREWALAPLRAAHAKSPNASQAVMHRILDEDASDTDSADDLLMAMGLSYLAGRAASFLRFRDVRELEADCTNATLFCAALMHPRCSDLEHVCVHGHMPKIMTTLAALSVDLPKLRRLTLGSERYDTPWMGCAQPWTDDNILPLTGENQSFAALEEFEVVGPRRGPGLKLHFAFPPPSLRRVVLSNVASITFVRGSPALDSCLHPDAEFVIKEQACSRTGRVCLVGSCAHAHQQLAGHQICRLHADEEGAPKDRGPVATVVIAAPDL